ncbi:AAA family ATPase [Paenibacillus sp. GCM10027626]|uniref:AAA family ATPase n=1 Tax=Paenibacillus sp. GCM10027626 TaxID=3273411 RepID=UPI00362F0649
MQKLAEILDIERSRLFVGRKSELCLVQDWLKRAQAPTEVLFLSGMGGVGKSALMLQFTRIARQEGATTVWLDGRACTDSPAGFMEALHHFFLSNPQAPHAADSSFQQLASAIATKKMVLCIDNYESLQRIEGWLREAFLSSLPATGLLVVLATRQDVSAAWASDLAWHSRSRSIHLGSLSREEALDYLRQRGWYDTNEMNQLISQSRGLPLAMALFVDRLRYPEAQPGSFAWPVSMQISAGMLREAASDEFKDLIDILCIIPHATPKWLGRFLGAPLTSVELQRICQLSFIRPTAGGIALHDVARTFLTQDFRLREPERYQSLWHRIIEELAIELKHATSHEKRRIASVMLSTCQDIYHINSVSVLSTSNLDSLHMESFQPFDLPHLHQMMKDEAQYSFSVEIDHAVIDVLSVHFPEDIRVYRNSKGKPIAFTAGLLLYKETVSLLERLFPGLLDTVFPKEIKRLRQSSIEEADTYYHLRASASPCDPIYTYHQLVGIIMKELITHKSVGMRYIIVTAYEETNESLQNAGFRMRTLPDHIREHLFQGAKAAIHEQDWRGTSFVDQILDLIHFAPDYKENRANNFELTEKEVKAAISLINDPEALAGTELAGKLACDGLKLQQKLHRIFLNPPPFPLNDNNLDLLKLYAEAPQVTVDAAAAQLNMSRATYYRVRKETLLNLKDVLIRKTMEST